MKIEKTVKIDFGKNHTLSIANEIIKVNYSKNSSSYLAEINPETLAVRLLGRLSYATQTVKIGGVNLAVSSREINVY